MEIDNMILHGNIILMIYLLICNYQVVMNYMLMAEGKSSLHKLFIFSILIIMLWISLINRNDYNIFLKVATIFLVNLIGQSLAIIVKFIELDRLGLLDDEIF